MKRAILFAAVSLLSSAVAVCIPQATPTPAPAANAHATPLSERQGPVKGAPYTAKRVVEATGTLRDGTVVDQINTVTVSRDSEGRTRMETDNNVQIQDPVGHLQFSLNKKTHVANIALRNTASPDQIQAAAQAALEAEQARKITSESLGTKMMEGLLVEGTRTTELRPYGNSATGPIIKIVEEHWYSQELKTDIMVIYDDPRQVTQITSKFTEIQLTEPDPALFQVPPDYTVHDPNKKREELQQ
jgi:hypothetical protein